jgi:uncharacterized protein (DUF2252 family)
MKMLKIERFGDEVQGIRLQGDPAIRPEPVHVRVVFPGGDVDVVRTSDGDYWVHVRVDSAQDVATEAAEQAGRIVDARLDIRSKHASETDVGDFAHPDLYHLAVRVTK